MRNIKYAFHRRYINARGIFEVRSRGNLIAIGAKDEYRVSSRAGEMRARTFARSLRRRPPSVSRVIPRLRARLPQRMDRHPVLWRDSARGDAHGRSFLAKRSLSRVSARRVIVRALRVPRVRTRPHRLVIYTRDDGEPTGRHISLGRIKQTSEKKKTRSILRTKICSKIE